jgi:2-C-methyl-D-erythritol 4-phosphate cytidylyltransferase/2-C-methyl-D-erythritol 2,4-cyclodiphosphate synthase
MLSHTLNAFDRPDIERVLVVIHPSDRQHYDRSIAACKARLSAPVAGGDTRQASVLAGLETLDGCAIDKVLVHDAARPFVSAGTIERVLSGLDRHDAVVAALPVADTLKRADATGLVGGTIDRNGMWRAQTPQGFRFEPFLRAHRAAAAAGRTDFTDDAAVAEWAGMAVHVVEGDERNVKITTAEDLTMAERLAAPASMPDLRTGSGFDVHRFGPGDAVWLCGVKVPHTAKLEGHSDADVALHALTDAILGAIADGDIGQHFPPGDAKWKGAASRLFLADAARRVRERGGKISCVDVTLLCEAPRISPHRDAMRAVIAEILGIDVGRVAVKATTTEGLGFTGRREGIAAMATATVILP